MWIYATETSAATPAVLEAASEVGEVWWLGVVDSIDAATGNLTVFDKTDETFTVSVPMWMCVPEAFTARSDACKPTSLAKNDFGFSCAQQRKPDGL